ncbi:MAG: DsbA family protein [Pseudomonadota bacterium]
MAKPGQTRRLILGLGGLALVWSAVPLVRRAMAPPVQYEMLSDPKGFRKVATGEVSVARGMLVGLDNRPPIEPILDADLCTVLFQTTPADRVPVAVFSDYNCPFCRVLSDWLIEAQDKGRIALTFHELPRLGPRSDMTARLALAAARQDAYLWFHKRFMASQFLPNDPYVLTLATERGIDGPRLLEDSEDPKIDRHLAQADALAARFGFPATPAMVVGRTAVLGAVERHILDQIIADESALRDSLPCGQQP